MTSSSHTRRDRGLAPPFTPDGPVLVAILGALDDLHDLIAERLTPIQEPAPDDPPEQAIPVQEPGPDDPPDKQAQPVQEPAPKRAPRKTTPRKQTGKAS